MDNQKEAASPKELYGDNNLREQPIDFYRQKYAEADPEEISRRLGIPYDPEKGQFALKFLGDLYTVHYPVFSAEPVEPQDRYYPLTGDQAAEILVLRYLLQTEVAPFADKFLSFREFPSGELYFRQFQGRCIFRLNHKYGSRVESFRRVCESMGLKKTDYADACYDMELFEGLYVRFIIWEGDDEFPASSQILFSANFVSAFETYDLAEIGGICIKTLGEREKSLQG